MRKSQYLTICLAFIFSIGFPYFANAQNKPINPGSVNVVDMSDEQINRLVNEIKARGLTMEEAIVVAKSRGANQQQIDQILSRIEKLNTGNKGATTKTNPYIINNPNINNTKKGLKSYSLSDTIESDLTRKAFIPDSLVNRRIFGYHFFNSKNLSFEPSLNIPTPKDYTIGIGDMVNISVWGASQANYQLRVENNGSINIPNIGSINIAGLVFDRAREVILSRLYSIYSGMTGAYPNTWGEVTLGALRSIKVNVVGEALVPGSYTLPATASAFNALYLSGGPNNNGSFREIKLIRDGVTIKKIDIYEFFIKGDAKANMQLRDQDILFIPSYGIRVDVQGEFKRTGLFEMKENETLSDLMRFTGGFAQDAYKSSLNIQRNTSTEREVKDVAAENFNTFNLKNGDIVNAGILLERFTNRVRIEGAVFRPGDYELSNGMMLSDLLQKAGGLTEDAFKNRALISRLRDDFTPENIAFDLNDILQKKNNIVLKKEDIVTIRSIKEMEEQKTIAVYGEVREPNTFKYYNNITLGDIILLAGGFTDNADASVIEVNRRLDYNEALSFNNKLSNIFRFAISKDLKLSPQDANFVLKPYDAVYIRRAPNYRAQGNIKVSGEVNYAGSYGILSRNEKVSDVIKRAGGLVASAYAPGATLTRTYKLTEADKKLRRDLFIRDTTLKLNLSDSIGVYIVGIELDKILANPGSTYDILVQPNDVINVPALLQTVKVSGSVLNPLALVYRKGASVEYYINQAGGYSPKANKRKTYVLLPNGTTSSTRAFHRPTVTPGSEIIVPAKPEKKSNDDALKWISAMGGIASVAVAIATIVTMSKK